MKKRLRVEFITIRLNPKITYFGIKKSGQRVMGKKMFVRLVVFLISYSTLAIASDSLKVYGSLNEEHYNLVVQAATLKNAQEALKNLSRTGVNLDAIRNDGRTALFSLVEELNLEGVKALLNAGADVNIRMNGTTPCKRALVFMEARASEEDIKKAEDIIELLLPHTEFMHVDEEYWFLLHATQINNIKVVILLTKKFNANLITYCGSHKSFRFALWHAIRNGNVEILKAFLTRDREASPKILRKMFNIIGEEIIKLVSLARIRAWLIEDQIEVTNDACLKTLDMGNEGSFNKDWREYQQIEYCDDLRCYEKLSKCKLHNQIDNRN